MFTVSEENTFKCLAGSSDIFGNGRTSSLVFGNIWQSSGIYGSLRTSEINCCKITENSLILNKIILAFLEPFLLLSGKNLLFQRIFTASVKCLKFNSFMLQSQKKWSVSVIEAPPLYLLNPFAPEPPVTARADPGPFYPLWRHQF